MSEEYTDWQDGDLKVVVNHEEQYSIWPLNREAPKGWREVGVQGKKDECLAYIKEVWTDMRPLSLRKIMDERRAGAEPLEDQPQEWESEEDPRDDLVTFLSTGVHPVEAGLRPERTIKEFKDAIERGYVHVKFTDTRGGTELGFRIKEDASDLSRVDFEQKKGVAHLVGDLTLNYVRVRCVADIDVETLAGEGLLEVLAEA